MTGLASAFDSRLLARTRVRSPETPIPLLVGTCGCGRTERLRRLRDALGEDVCQYIDFERVAMTPERCYASITARSPFVVAEPASDAAANARTAFDALLGFLMNARRRDGGPALFLLDEILELRTFESFPGLRAAQTETARALANSPNGFVLSTRFETRARRWVQAAPDRFEVIPVEPLQEADIRETLVDLEGDPDDLAQTVAALVGAHPGYVRALANQMALMRRSGAIDPISAFAAAMAPDGELAARCRFSYELRLHRARGYGALKAILDVLADEEPLTLTGIAQRLDRTPGSTKDYLTWLQDVDLVACDRKRYRFADPLLRLWVRVHRGADIPSDDRVIGEVQMFALERLRHVQRKPVPAAAAAPQAERVRSAASDSGIIEID